MEISSCEECNRDSGVDEFVYALCVRLIPTVLALFLRRVIRGLELGLLLQQSAYIGAYMFHVSIKIEDLILNSKKASRLHTCKK